MAQFFKNLALANPTLQKSFLNSEKETLHGVSKCRHQHHSPHKLVELTSHFWRQTDQLFNNQ